MRRNPSEIRPMSRLRQNTYGVVIRLARTILCSLGLLTPNGLSAQEIATPQHPPAVITAQEIATLADTGLVLSVAFSPDGATLASGGMSGTVTLWDVTLRQEIGTLRGHSDWVNSVAFSPDGATLVSGGKDTTVMRWDLASRQEIATVERHRKQVRSVSFSPDGATLATGGIDATVRLWDVATREEIARSNPTREQMHLSDHAPPTTTVSDTRSERLLQVAVPEITREIIKEVPKVVLKEVPVFKDKIVQNRTQQVGLSLNPTRSLTLRPTLTRRPRGRTPDPAPDPGLPNPDP